MPWFYQREIHRFHHIAAMGLSIFSMYFDDDAVFSERIVILWSIPYFCVDIFDLILIKDYIYVLHHAMVLTLGFFNYNNPLLYEMRMNSRAVWLELSTILLHIVQNSKDPILFVVFAVTFTLCRLVWIPLGIINPLLQNGMDWYDWPIVAVSAFYGLNLYWYMKILKILFKNMNMLLSSSSPSPSSRDVIASKKASKQG